MIRYHDHEWGRPVHDDRTMFEFLVLETFQAGLSWRTVLHKRKNFGRAFAQFDYRRVAKFRASDLQRLLRDRGIIRNRQKIKAAINNAQQLTHVRQEWPSFSDYLWHFVRHKTVQHSCRTSRQIPAITPLAVRIAKDLKQRGFQFLGPTVVYAHLQATGLVNDHLVSCFRYKQLRCLCFGFAGQTTNTRFPRRITRHFLHMGLTDDRTFIVIRDDRRCDLWSGRRGSFRWTHCRPARLSSGVNAFFRINGPE